MDVKLITFDSLILVLLYDLSHFLGQLFRISLQTHLCLTEYF